ncbi:MAG: tetratricopeptide repeat protein [Thermoguttaceae bacterium]
MYRFLVFILFASLVTTTIAGVVVLNSEKRTVIPAPAVEPTKSCAGCHEQERKEWETSFHAHAMDHATSETVLGDFNDVTFTHVGFDDIVNLADNEVATLLAVSDIQMRTYAIASFDTTDEAADKLRKNMTGEQLELFEKEILHRKKIGFTRPGEIAAAHQLVTDKIRELAAGGKINIDFGSRFTFTRKDSQSESSETDATNSLPHGTKFFVKIDNRQEKPTGIQAGKVNENQVFEIKYVLGIFPLQQYLVEFPDGRVQCLPIAWNCVQNKWYHLYPKERILPNDPLHWTGPMQNWNNMCAACHTTDLEKNFDLKTNSFKTAFTEIRVGCKSCHGAEVASNIVPEKCARGNRSNTSRSNTNKLNTPGTNNTLVSESDKTDLLSKNEAKPVISDNETSNYMSVCMGCHSRRRVLTDRQMSNGDEFLDFYIPETPHLGYYYADGQILEEDFEYGSFSQSRMYANGVTCTDCHNPHTGRVKYEGNRLCAQCHSPEIYDATTHHFHENGKCVDCHMPSAMYMVADKRFDHSMQKPRPELSLDLGTPNGCNLCHFDAAKGEDAAWAKKWTDTWYAEKRKSAVGYSNSASTNEHFAYAIAKGRAGDVNAVPALVKIAQETNEREIRPITRASAVALLARFDTPEARDAAKHALTDSSGLVRVAALANFESASDKERLENVTPLLADPLRAVRTEAARILTPVPKKFFTQSQYDSWKKSVTEYLDSMKAVDDTAAAHLNLAMFRYYQAMEQLLHEYETSGSQITPEAFRKATEPVVTTYKISIYLDPLFLPSRINLAMLYNERQEQDLAEKEFRTVLEIDPKLGEIHYSLALLLAEMNRYAETVEHFEKAVEFQPDNARIRYNFGLALMKLDKNEEAEKQLSKSLQLDPKSNEAARALLILRDK